MNCKVFIILILIFCGGYNLKSQETGIKPYSRNPSFWEYKNQPILLFGGSNNNNLFQNLNLVEELNKIKASGGNYVLCTLSSSDEGNEMPFWRSGIRYNLNKFNVEFWRKLDNFFKLTADRGIIVQVEIWAFHDFLETWEKNPWNPKINNVLTETNTKLKSENYGDIETAKHDFFFSVPKLNNDLLLLSYQKMFVDHLLSISLKYNHILYCVTSEIFPQYSHEWGWYWANYLKEKAKQAGVQIQVTELFNNPDITSNQHMASINHPELFSFFEASQNSRMANEKHWGQLQKVRKLIAVNPRPINHVKIYGGQKGEWTDGPEHGIERFWRNLIGGAASVNFYKPPSGIGITERAQAHLNSARLLANEYNFFTSKPDINFSLLLERKEDEAYFASNENKDAVVYFTDGGQVVIDFTDFKGVYKLKWLNLEGANWYREVEIKGEGVLELATPYSGSWIALLKKISK